jgi:hypothetical protein
MAAPTVTKTKYGLNVTGGVDATSIVSDLVRLKKIIVTSVGTAAGIVTVTSVVGTVHLGVFSGGSIGISQVHNFGTDGIEVDGLRATMGTTGHIANFIFT